MAQFAFSSDPGFTQVGVGFMRATPLQVSSVQYRAFLPVLWLTLDNPSGTGRSEGR